MSRSRERRKRLAKHQGQTQYRSKNVHKSTCKSENFQLPSDHLQHQNSPQKVTVFSSKSNLEIFHRETRSIVISVFLINLKNKIGIEVLWNILIYWKVNLWTFLILKSFHHLKHLKSAYLLDIPYIEKCIGRSVPLGIISGSSSELSNSNLIYTPEGNFNIWFSLALSFTITTVVKSGLQALLISSIYFWAVSICVTNSFYFENTSQNL